jgi:hypothetical protein
MKSSHDFELRKTTETHAFLDQVGPLFCTYIYRIKTLIDSFQVYSIYASYTHPKNELSFPLLFVLETS